MNRSKRAAIEYRVAIIILALLILVPVLSIVWYFNVKTNFTRDTHVVVTEEVIHLE